MISWTFTDNPLTYRNLNKTIESLMLVTMILVLILMFEVIISIMFNI